MSGSNPQTVLVVDDHPFIRASIVQELERDGTYRVCGEAGSAAEALALLRRIRPDFAILDLSLEEGSGMEILAYLQEHCPDCLPVVVTMHEEPAYIEQALQGGARGYIFKRESVQSVRQALREVRAGRIFGRDDWQEAGRIPRFCLMADGSYADTVLFWKELP